MPTQPPGPIDINSADVAEIASGVGLDAPTAERIVATRVQRQGFRDLDDLVVTAGLQPHELLKLRGKVAFGSYRPTMPSTSPAPEQPFPPTEPPSGRILDY